MTFNNDLIGQEVYRKRDQFVRELRQREEEILQLASSVCGRGPCSFFRHSALGEYFVHGSYNFSFFIEFEDGEKCVLRIPLRPCLAYNAQEKLRSEIVTMQHLTGLGKIPMPKILAHRTDDGADPLSTFLILEFIDGKQLSPGKLKNLEKEQRDNLFTSLADIYLHLRRQEFPAIGRLDGSAESPHVGQKTASIFMNMLQLEGIDSFGIRDSFHDEDTVLKSATSYTKMLQCIGYNAFLKSPNSISVGMGLEVSHNHQLFIKHTEGWLDVGRDEGPFVLVHGDLHLSNLVFDDEFHVIGVLDWEWSSAVPVQYFTPPLWLSGRDTVQLANPTSWQLFLKTALKDFLEIVKARETKMFGNLLLHSEWSQTVANAEPLVANALLNWTDVDWFVHRYIRNQQTPSNDERATLVKENPSLAVLARIKEHDLHSYLQSLEHRASQKSTDVKEKETWTLMQRIHHVSQHASTMTNILGWSVAAYLIVTAIWRRR